VAGGGVMKWSVRLTVGVLGIDAPRSNLGHVVSNVSKRKSSLHHALTQRSKQRDRRHILGTFYPVACTPHAQGANQHCCSCREQCWSKIVNVQCHQALLALFLGLSP
jgi:hypothetical protein